MGLTPWLREASMNRIARWWGRVQAVLSWGLEAGLAELPRACDWGMKRNSHGSLERWRGYRLHLDVCDPGLPLSAQTTSASLHDSQVAIPMARETAWRVTTFAFLAAGPRR